MHSIVPFFRFETPLRHRFFYLFTAYCHQALLPEFCDLESVIVVLVLLYLNDY